MQPDTANAPKGAEILLDRRALLVSTAAIGGGMALGIGTAMARPKAAASATGPWGADSAAGIEFSPWVEIAADDSVTIRVPTPEIGNGAMTQVAMNVAEELACDWSKVHAVFASVQRNFAEGGVYDKGFHPFFGGGGTNRVRMAHCLQVGASTRERLKAAAAARWHVPASEIDAENSILTHRPTGRKLRYGEVAGAAGKIVLPQEPALKPQAEWRLIGKATPTKLNNPAIVRGEAVFGIDVKLPGMRYAALMQAPVHGGSLKSHNPEAVLKMPGVRAVVVIDPAQTRGSPVPAKPTFGFGDTKAQWGVAVVADHYWQAKQALEALPVEWDMGDGARWTDSDQIHAVTVAARDKAVGRPLRQAGDKAAATGKRVVTAEYTTPYGDNAALEPLNATALVTADAVEVWCPTQDRQQAFWVVIDETGMAPEKVKVHQTFVGGGFGRRTQAEDVRMATAIARAHPGVPIKTIWTREECFRQGRYRTPVSTRFRATLDDATGLPQSMTAQVAYTGTSPSFQLPLGLSDQPYLNSGIVPHVDITAANMPIHILNGAWRGPCYNSHVFMVESFIDDCAIAARIDPLDYRLKLLANWDKPWSDCLRLVAEKAGWGKVLPRGEGLGIAISCWPVASKHDNGTVVATAVRLSVSKQGEIRVHQIDVAFDCGRVANADAVRSQIEGANLFGLNAVLNEEVTIKDGAIVEGNFDEYPMIRMADAPPVHVHFGALSGHDRMEIVGEAPVGPVQAAVGNAILAATGKRLYRTPFRKHDLSWS